MNSFIVFTKKEFMEHIRTRKFMIMIIILLFSAFISAPAAKYMPELFKAMMPNMPLEMPEPTYIQGYEQFFKNISQLGLWVIIFALMGSVCKEKDNGSAIIVLTKPLTRATMIMSKFLVASVMFTVAYAFAYVVHIIYSLILFEAAGNIDAFLSIAMMWLYCILVIAITISMSAICKKTLTSGVMSFVILFILTILSSLPILKLDKLSPGVLATVNKVIAEGNVGKEIPNLLAGGKMEVFITWGQIGISIAITTLFIAILLFIGTKKFEKQEL